MMKAGQHAYKDRKRKKRDFRALWITRISAAARAENVSYSRLVKAMKEKNIQLDRKVLSELALLEPGVFTQILKEAKVK